MTIWTHRTLLVPPAYAALARGLAAGLDPVAGSGMFVVPCYDTTTGTLSYYISSGLIGEQFAAVLDSPEVLYAACTAAGAGVTLATCQSMLAACIVSDGTHATTIDGEPVTVAEDVHALLGRLNLTLQGAPE